VVNSKLAQAGSGGSGLVDGSMRVCFGLASRCSTATRYMGIYGACTVHLLLMTHLSGLGGSILDGERCCAL
jgi:hypothetical protein